MRILLIEDDEVLTSVLTNALQQQRYVVDAIDDGRFGLEYAESGTYDLLLIDVGLPRLDGISLCQQLRHSGNTTPVLLMTAKDAPDEKIRGLDAGADDYLTKPFNIGELHARLRALLRRGEVSPTTVLEIGQLRLNPVSCEVTYASSLLKLTPKEYSLLELFLRNPTRVFSRSHIIEHLWTFDDPPLEDSVKAHIKGLRRRLKKAGADGWIENVYGLGYKLSPKIDYEAIAQQKEKANPSETPANQTVTEQITPEQVTPEQTTTAPNTDQQFQQAMADLWQQHRSAMTERLSHLQQAETALQQNALTGPQRQAAAGAAHKLAGVLGMFGQDDGTQIARALETLLSDEKTPPSLTTLSPLITQLTQLVTLTDQSYASAAIKPAIKPAIEPATFRPPSTATPTTKILAVDDDPIFLSTLPPLLEPWGLSVTLLSDLTQFWDTLTATDPDLLILDIEMPQQTGIALCQALRTSPHAGPHAGPNAGKRDRWQSLPILFLTARQNAAAEVFAAGADDYIVKPVLGPELITRISNRLERARLLKTLSSRDSQTGLANQSQSQQDFHALSRSAKAYTFILIRLDNLAQINLEHGHSAGHQVLKAWGEAIATQFLARVPDAIASYWGNGEFVIGLANMDTETAKEAIAPLLRHLRQLIFTTATAPNSSPKVSRFQAQYALGLAAFPTQGKTLQALYQNAYAIAN